MKILKFIFGFVCAIFLLLFSSCRSSRTGTTNVVTHSVFNSPEELINSYILTNNIQGTVVSKLNLDLSFDGKTLSVGGNISLCRDSLISLSLVYMGLFEVGRIEFTPEYVLMINRMEKQYVYVEYKDFSYLQRTGIDFESLQALFWAQLFVPSKGTQYDVNDFVVDDDEQYFTISTHGDSPLVAKFILSNSTSLLSQTSITNSNSKNGIPYVNCAYQHFVSLGEYNFPDEMLLSIDALSGRPRAQISLSNPKWTDKGIEPTQFPGEKYKRIAADKFFKSVVK